MRLQKMRLTGKGRDISQKSVHIVSDHVIKYAIINRLFKLRNGRGLAIGLANGLPDKR